MNRAGAVIVSYNSEREIGRCLDSLPPDLAVVVVDNASTDGTLSEIRRRPQARLIANPWNRGFAAAANQGIAVLDCGCVLLLNPDIELIGGLDFLAAECEKTGTAAAGGKLLGENERPQMGFMVRRFPTPLALAFEVTGVNRLWPGNPVNRRYRALDLNPDIAAKVEQPAGAMLMIQREIWQRLGGFDESFHPVWFEDVDFLKRAAAAGYTARYVPEAVARHKGGHSVTQVPRTARDLYWYGNLLSYAARHFPRSSRLAVCSALMLGSIIRAITGIFRSASLKPVVTYARVFRLAAADLFAARREIPIFSPAFIARQGGAIQ
jgi:GT2 family glycosyltransferase